MDLPKRFGFSFFTQLSCLMIFVVSEWFGEKKKLASFLHFFEKYVRFHSFSIFFLKTMFSLKAEKKYADHEKMRC